ncbi:MAG: RNA polymerase sigma factor [Planctomycetota bacterium]|jgi:RNA polymerase sigma factor (sigma-70 family)
MSEMSQMDRDLLVEIRNGKSGSWEQLIEEYEGRLLNFATARLPQRADAEDIVQDAFVSFVKGLDKFRGETSLETYLFIILRNKIFDRYRSRRSRSVCLIQDVYAGVRDDDRVSIFERMSAPDPTASWYISQVEDYKLQRKALIQSLRDFLKVFKSSQKFRDLKMIELLFYCKISNKDVANLFKLEKTTVRVFKHRCLKQIRRKITKLNGLTNFASSNFEHLITEIWESNRLSCPKRSTLGGFLLETLEPEWFDYVDFHLTTLGCHFCRANLKDLKRHKTTNEQRLFRKRIMESTVGFLSNS